MAFREKKAWATILALLVVFLPYYFVMARTYHQPDPNFYTLMHLALAALVTFVVLELLLVFIARRMSPEDANIPLDEREQLFAFRSARAAYITLIALVILVSFLNIHAHGANWGWGMAYLLAIIVSEIVRATMLLIQYQRG